MGTEQLNRKLAAILYADVAGYSRLTGEDEEGTHRALRTYLDLITDSVNHHNGKVTHYAGDAVLADFATVSAALSCAVAIQSDLKTRNQDLPDNRKVQFRIGANLGEVIVDRDEIYGDGVNIAARLESLAEPGGICISGTVYDAIGTKLPIDYEFLGEQSVKNIEKPVRTYSARLKPGTTLPAPTVRVKPQRPMRHLIVAAVAAFVLLVGAGVMTWWQPWQAREEPASVERMTLPLPEKPSIAVLPFVNISGDPGQEYFSDGITNDLITDLSKLSNLFVIASNSVFTYKGTPVKIQQVGRDLGVRYVLEGSVQRAGERVRINAQLIEATTGHHLWAERFDRELTDVFALQDEVTHKIVTALFLKLTEEERKYLAHRYTNNYEAYDHFLRGQSLYAGHTKEDNEQAREMFTKAIELDPTFARAYGPLALTHADDFRYGWSTNPLESAERGLELAHKAVALDDSLPQIYWVLGYIYLYGKKQHEEAIDKLEKAVVLDPNYADGYALLASIHSYTDRLDEVIALIRKAMRLNPHFPSHYFTVLGRAYYLAGRFDEAIPTLQTAIDRNYNYLPHHVHLAATYARMGQQDEAEWEVEQIVTLDPDFSLEFLAKTYPYKDPAHLNRLMNDLRKAGIPEKPPFALPDKPSIAVLPFDNLSDDPKQEYFADGMTDDLITDLSKISGLFVIARNSSFAYKGKSPDVRQVSRELGVKYVLEGSVRRVGEQVRINAQLIDATSGGHLWAERYDGSLADIFALQDKITGKIVAALAVQLTADESEQAAMIETVSVAAYDAFLQGWDYYQRRTGDDLAKALGYFEKAVELDPIYGRAHAALALTYFIASERGLEGSLGVPWSEARYRARQYLALALNNPTSIAHQVASMMALKQRLYGQAITHAERAIALDPSDANAYAELAYALNYDGRPDEAVEAANKAMRIDPNRPSAPLRWQARAHFAKGNLQEALAKLERVRAHYSSFVPPGLALSLAATYAHLGRGEEARSAFQHYRKLWKSRAPTLKDVMHYWPFKDPTVAKRFADGLFKAGLSGPPGGYYVVSERDRLSGDKIKSLVFGRKITGVDPWEGDIWSLERTRDGKATCKRAGTTAKEYCAWRRAAEDPSNATNWIENDRLCERFKVSIQEYETCFPIFRNPEGTPKRKNEYLAMTDVGIYPWSPVD